MMGHIMAARLHRASLLSALALTACANLNTAYRDFNIDDGAGAMVDIKQRAVIVSRQKDDNGVKRSIVCAEPSPDALSAYAAELAAEGGNGQVTASLAAAMQESAAYVGLRTQSIQLLRDSFYRACEGYMSGALNSTQFDILTRRHQRFMVALLGIEQLTGAVRAPAVTISTEGRAAAGLSVAAYRAQIDALDAEIATFEEEIKTQQKVVNDDKASKEAKEAANARIAELNKKIARKKEDKALLQTGLANAQGVAAGGRASASVSSVGVLDTRSDAALEKVADNVRHIVDRVLDTDELAEVCITAYAAPEIQRNNGGSRVQLNSVLRQSTNSNVKDFAYHCADLVEAMIKSRTARNNLAEQITQKLDRDPKASAVEIERALGALEAALHQIK